MFKSHYDCRGANGPCALQYHNTRLFFVVSEAMNICWTTPRPDTNNLKTATCQHSEQVSADDVVMTLTCGARDTHVTDLLLHVMCDV